MADVVNSQVTDAAVPATPKVLAEAPAVAMAHLYQATAQALANAAHNAVHSQQQTQMTLQAATAQAVAALLAGKPQPPV